MITCRHAGVHTPRQSKPVHRPSRCGCAAQHTAMIAPPSLIDLMKIRRQRLDAPQFMFRAACGDKTDSAVPGRRQTRRHRTAPHRPAMSAGRHRHADRQRLRFAMSISAHHRPFSGRPQQSWESAGRAFRVNAQSFFRSRFPFRTLRERREACDTLRLCARPLLDAPKHDYRFVFCNLTNCQQADRIVSWFQVPNPPVSA
jgi:hypothetical protein